MNKNITVIPARKQVRRRESEGEKPKLRVAAYCRVSTDTDEQATSYEAQIEHYTDFISHRPDWVLAGIYADDGISGTNTKKREEFNRMIQDCEDGQIDMIITKSISRFARNTLDCLQYIRQLKAKNIPVFFEKENINTMDAKGEVLLTIMASLAQQESQSLSQNVKLGIQYRFQDGKVQVNHNRFMGYTKDADGMLVIVPEEAEIVKRIYYEYLEGASMLDIARGLEADGILTGAGKTHWRPETIRKMLTNEKYMGDALLQKTYTVDFLTKKRVKNTGIVPQYYVENSHPAIIPRDLYMRTQEEIVRRSNLKKANGRRRVYSSRYALSSIVYCSHCGDVFRRTHWNIHGNKKVVWRCSSRLEKAGPDCPARTLSEAFLHEAVVDAVNQVLDYGPEALDILQENVKKTLVNSNTVRAEEIDQELEKIQHELLRKANAKQDYDSLADQIDVLREEKQRLLTSQASQEGKLERINELTDFIKNQPAHVTEYDESLVRKLIEKVTVYDDRLEFEFKSGAEAMVPFK